MTGQPTGAAPVYKDYNLMLTDKLTDASPIYQQIRGTWVYTDWSIFLMKQLIMSETSWILGKTDLMDLPLEFQAGLMMALLNQ